MMRNCNHPVYELLSGMSEQDILVNKKRGLSAIKAIRLNLARIEYKKSNSSRERYLITQRVKKSGMLKNALD